MMVCPGTSTSIRVQVLRFLRRRPKFEDVYWISRMSTGNTDIEEGGMGPPHEQGGPNSCPEDEEFFTVYIP
jgi:hypothetical protein